MDDGGDYGEARPSSSGGGGGDTNKRKLEAGGLTLERSSNVAGYRGVSVRGTRYATIRYAAIVRRAGKQVQIGTFDTAAEAALAYAMSPEAQAAAGKLKPRTEPKPCPPPAATMPPAAPCKLTAPASLKMPA
jgi:hypothetical protein